MNNKCKQCKTGFNFKKSDIKIEEKTYRKRIKNDERLIKKGYYTGFCLFNTLEWHNPVVEIKDTYNYNIYEVKFIICPVCGNTIILNEEFKRFDRTETETEIDYNYIDVMGKFD